MTQWPLSDPQWLFLLLAIPIVAWLRSRRTPTLLMVPFAASWHRPGISGTRFGSAVAAYLGAVLLIVALARPQQIDDKRESEQSGYDIILAIDLSGSMKAEDYRRGSSYINRWQAVKPVIEAIRQLGDRGPRRDKSFVPRLEGSGVACPVRRQPDPFEACFVAESAEDLCRREGAAGEDVGADELVSSDHLRVEIVVDGDCLERGGATGNE